MLLAELLLCCLPAAGDSIPPPPPPLPVQEDLVNVTECMPILPGCEAAPTCRESQKCTRDSLSHFVATNLRWPAPDWCGKGTAVVGFIIGRNGKIRSDTIYRNIPGAETEIIRMMELITREFPQWKPGTVKGNPVAVRYNLPIRFKLE